MYILVINAGSSSLKYQVFNADNFEVKAKGLCERIGIDGHIKHSPIGKEGYEADIEMKDHSKAIRVVIDLLTSKEHGVIASMDEIGAVGHRVAHGGEYFSEAVLIDDEVLKGVEACVPLAPLHNPASLMGIRACMDVMKDIPQTIICDTAFHQTMPKYASLYALPYEYYEKYRVRRYGFHGTSHRYVAGRAAALMGKPLEELKIVTCHLGNGSSIAAVDHGKVLDTSMGFTPLAGLPMGTRTGDLDPAIVTFIMKEEGLSVEEMDTLLNKKSGVLGVSGISSDFRDLTAAAAQGNERAKTALDMFHYGVRKYIGAYAAAMGGIDAVVFTAGIGENDAVLRAEATKGLEFMGIAIDAEKNKIRGKEVDISAPTATVKSFIIPTNEELVIAQDTKKLVDSLQK